MVKWQRIKSLVYNKEAKTLAENFTYLSLLQVAGYVFPLITLPYLAKTIGVDKFGAIAFGLSVIIYFQTFVDYGFHYTAVRDISQKRDDLKAVSKLVSTVIIIRCIFMIISFILLLILIYTLPFFYNNRVILFLTFLYIPGQVFFPDWFFQAVEKMKYITFMTFFSKLLFTVLVFVVIKEKADYIYQPVLTSIGYIVSGLISMIIIRVKFKLSFYLPSLKEIYSTIKDGFNMFVCLLFPNLYTNFSIILLRMLGGEVPTGIYSSGEKFISLSSQFSNILTRAFFPFLARRIDKHSLYRNIAGVFSILMSLFLFFGAELLVRIFYTEEFISSVIVIRIMSVAPILFFLMETYGTNYLVLLNKENTLRNIIVLCSLIGFGLSWLLVSKYSYIGAALAITITWLIRGIITWIVAQRLIRRNKKVIE